MRIVIGVPQFEIYWVKSIGYMYSILSAECAW